MVSILVAQESARSLTSQYSLMLLFGGLRTAGINADTLFSLRDLVSLGLPATLADTSTIPMQADLPFGPTHRFAHTMVIAPQIVRFSVRRI